MSINHIPTEAELTQLLDELSSPIFPTSKIIFQNDQQVKVDDEDERKSLSSSSSSSSSSNSKNGKEDEKETIILGNSISKISSNSNRVSVKTPFNSMNNLNLNVITTEGLEQFSKTLSYESVNRVFNKSNSHEIIPDINITTTTTTTTTTVTNNPSSSKNNNNINNNNNNNNENANLAKRKLETELSLDALSPTSENSPLHKSSGRPLSMLISDLPKLIDHSDSDSDSTTSDSTSTEDEVDDLSTALNLSNDPRVLTEDEEKEEKEFHEQLKSRLRVLSTESLLNSSSRLPPNQRIGSIRIRNSTMQEEDIRLANEFEIQSRRNSILISQQLHELNMMDEKSETESYDSSDVEIIMPSPKTIQMATNSILGSSGNHLFTLPPPSSNSPSSRSNRNSSTNVVIPMPTIDEVDDKQQPQQQQEEEEEIAQEENSLSVSRVQFPPNNIPSHLQNNNESEIHRSREDIERIERLKSTMLSQLEFDLMDDIKEYDKQQKLKEQQQQQEVQKQHEEEVPQIVIQSPDTQKELGDLISDELGEILAEEVIVEKPKDYENLQIPTQQQQQELSEEEDEEYGYKRDLPIPLITSSSVPTLGGSGTQKVKFEEIQETVLLSGTSSIPAIKNKMINHLINGGTSSNNNNNNRLRKESIADRWDIGRKEPRRSMSLNIQRVGDDFSVQRVLAKKPNESLEKMLIHISLVDLSHKVICITEDFYVQDVILLFAEKLGLSQTEFFSLAEITMDGCDRWLDPKKLVKDAGIVNLSKLVFKIKFFKQPKKLNDAKAVHLFYLQVQNSVVNGFYPCSEAMSFRLSALQFFVTFGAFNKEKHIAGFLDHGDLSEFIPSQYFFDLPDEYIQKRLFNLYGQIQCGSNIEAKLRYLDLANKIPTFGVTSFYVYDGIKESSFTRHKRHLCVAENGILISRKDRPGYDVFSYKELISYIITTRGIQITIPHTSITQNSTEIMNFDTSSHEQSMNIIELINGYKYFIQYDDSLKGLCPTPPIDPNISLLVPLFQSPKPRSKIDPLRSRLELFKLNYLSFCNNFKTQPIYKFLDQIDKVLDKEGSFRNNLIFDKLELNNLNLKGSDLSFIADALKDTLNLKTEENENIVENLHLTILDLSNNPLLATDAVEALKTLLSCNTILHLNLKNIGLTNKGSLLLITIIEKYQNLETLQIGKNRLSESGIRSTLKAIKHHNVALKSLGIEETNLTDSGCYIIEKLLTNNKTLTSLNISKNKITESGFKLIFDGIKKNPNLQDLNISGNPIQTNLMNKFIKWLTASTTNITKLNIASTSLNSSSGQELQKLLVSSGCHLVNFDVSYNNLGSGGSKHVIKGFNNNHNIQEFSLCANKISSSSINELCDRMETQPACNKLYLRYCDLGSKSILRIAKMMELNSTLTVIDLSMNKLNKAICISLGVAFSKNTSIEEVYLTQCQIGFKEIGVLLAGLESNNHVKKIFLDVNPITKKGISYIAQLLNINTSIEVMTLRNINVTAKDILEFFRKLHTSVAINQLNITENLVTNLTPQIKIGIAENVKRLCQISIQY
ncbi:filopodin [Tieghemostelium lacteum]|uniref:Filopodin n=1 Tax=Tieghemostelium lacteum TaxID=361077 RepID=A0A152A158_TIELA|nr:filopodin [Tieghemostelium lacteum]|eukprot:KYQ99981.1 filopodin [Tieghemostelium lacteum]